MQLNPAEIKGKVTTIVKEAGNILEKYFSSGVYTSHSKGGVDFATEADDAIDAFLRNRLRSAFPETQFLTEETAPDDYSSFEQAENVWIIDPIDGTTNFSRRDPHCCISVAFASKAEVILGIVYAPMEGKLYVAEKNDGSASLNGHTLAVSKTDSLSVAVIQTDWPWSMEGRQIIYKKLQGVFGNVRSVKMKGSAALDLANLAAGGIDGYFITGAYPWDIAAAALFVEKAGGKLTTFDGGPWNIFSSEILATNGILHEQVIELLNKS
ncbi:MAG: inositol monophosphatase [Candidatus Levybacteria bacterium]|nr:inositol monophosphatase [Candidatus Levybacteria bacterium]